ncbi:UNVERIFIED_CONTAM: right-handed parallel beta-helix repeat-containing protein, partial [Bacteroidetes bacterium 56_B9]
MHHLVVSGGNHTGGTGVGGGIQVRAGSYLKLYDSTVTQSLAVRGGGIGIDSPGAPQSLLSNCRIVNNTANGTYTGGG